MDCEGIVVVESVLSLLFLSILLTGVIQTSATINRSTHHEFDVNFPFTEYVEVVDALGPPWPWPGRYIELMETEERCEGDERENQTTSHKKKERVTMKL